MRHLRLVRLFGVLFVLLMVLAAGLYSVRVYNEFQVTDEQIKAAGSNLDRLYQRRAELVPALVETVQVHARNEAGVLREVVEARDDLARLASASARAGDDGQLERRIAAQQRMDAAVPSLLSIAEHYPVLRSNAAYLDLQIRLEGMENRLTYARWKYIDAVARYNRLVRRFPSSVLARLFGYAPMPVFESEATGAGKAASPLPVQRP